VRQIAGVLGQSVRHKTHQGNHDQPAQRHAEQLFRNWPTRSEPGEEVSKKLPRGQRLPQT
jgi:hypothetical protein